MLKIVDVHTSSRAQGEYIVLLNEGLLTVKLRGWALCTDAFIMGDLSRLAEQLYVFRQDVQILPYARVVLFTGHGVDGWKPTTDDAQAYCAYWERADRVWSSATQVHLLHLAASRRVVRPPAAANVVPEMSIVPAATAATASIA